MKIQQKTKEGAEILEIHGEIDLYSSPELRDCFGGLAAKKKSSVVANLKDVSYIDSSGLATFIEAYQKLSAYDGQLYLCHLSDTVRGVFEIARLEDVLTILGTEEEALNAAKAPRAS
jgi:anti-sigma B factor antagonist